VGHSQHNGLLAAEKRCRDKKDYRGSQKRENETIEPTRTSGSRDDEDVSNTKDRIGQSTEWQRRESIRGGSDDRIWFKGERENIETNVSNTEVIGTRESGNTDQEKRNESSGSTQSNSSSEDVSNTNESLRGGRRTIPLGRENKVWRFRVEEEGIRDNLRIETIGRNAVSREDVSYTEHKGLQRGQRNNKGEGRQILSPEQQNGDEVRSETGRIDGVQREERDVTNTNNERTQISTQGGHTGIEMSGSSSQKTWWQIESDLCGVPNGISYELDKDRANRIKTLGNAIVPQIAREFGLAIKKVLSDEDII